MTRSRSPTAIHDAARAVEPDDAAADSFLLSIVTAILVILLLNKFRASSKTRSEFESWIEIGSHWSPVVAKASKLENASRKSWWKPSFSTLLLMIVAGAEALLLQKTLFARRLP